MSDEQPPSVDEIKERLKIEIPVEEEDLKKEQAEYDVTEELRNLGRQVAETLRTAWASEERQKIEGEVRHGVNAFVTEVDKVFREVRESPAAQRAREEAAQVKTRVETGEVGRKARYGLVQGLQWLSEGLGELAERFSTPPETAQQPEQSDEG